MPPPHTKDGKRALGTTTIIFALPSSAIRLLTKLPPLASPLHRLRSLSTRGGIAAGTVGRGVAMQPVAKRQRPPDALGDEMKQYEAETCNAKVDTSRPCVVRLDGHWCVVRRANTQHQWPPGAHSHSRLTPHSRSFHTYTKGFRRPYDTRINAAMVATATDLLERFGAVTAYTESDEISLVWPPAAAHGVQLLPFNGRVQKVVSVTAGDASARFNKHMLAQTFDPQTEAALIARVEASEAHFDARVFSLPSTERLHGYMRWRALQDCRRNSISMLAQAHFSPAQLHGVEARTMLRMLLEDKGVDWLAQPAFFRYGSYVKKEEFTKQAFNPKTQQQARRGGVCAWGGKGAGRGRGARGAPPAVCWCRSR